MQNFTFLGSVSPNALLPAFLTHLLLLRMIQHGQPKDFTIKNSMSALLTLASVDNFTWILKISICLIRAKDN